MKVKKTDIFQLRYNFLPNRSYLNNIPDTLKPKLKYIIENNPGYSKSHLLYGFIRNIGFICSPYYDCAIHKFHFMIWFTSVSIRAYTSQNHYITEFILKNALNSTIVLFHYSASSTSQKISPKTIHRELNLIRSKLSSSSLKSLKSNSSDPVSHSSPAQTQPQFKSKPSRQSVTSSIEPIPSKKTVDSRSKTANTAAHKISEKAILRTTSTLTDRETETVKNTSEQKSTHSKIYAIITVRSENIYNLFLVNDKNKIHSAQLDSSYPPVVLDEENDKELFIAAIYSIKNQISDFVVPILGKIKKYQIIDIIHLDRNYFQLFSNKGLNNISFTDRVFPVTVYNRTNGCFRDNHPILPFNAIVSARTAKGQATLKVFKCLKCNKFFVTSQAIKAQGGYDKLHISVQFDPSCTSSDYYNVYDYYWGADDAFDDFAPSTSFHDDGYTTRKSDYERRRILAYFIDSGKHSKEECITYLQNFTSRNLYGENATQKALSDYYFVLQYNSEDDETIKGKLKRKK